MHGVGLRLHFFISFKNVKSVTIFIDLPISLHNTPQYVLIYTSAYRIRIIM